VREAHEEHRLVKLLVAEISEMEAGDEQFDAKMKVLKDMVEHHVEEEEGELMPDAKKLLSSDELDELGERVESRKTELKSQPQGARERSAGRTLAARGARRRSSPSSPGRARSGRSASGRSRSTGGAGTARRRSSSGGRSSRRSESRRSGR
jgi:hypothetical protein